GTTTVVIEGAELGDKETLLLDNGYEVECDLRIEDPFKITDKQRRKIFALCNDIESHTGQPRDYMRYLFQEYVTVLYGTTTVVIEGAELGDKETLLLDNGYEVECDLRI
ncbi:putative HNHc nuclease, partial [Staphylococcus aureus]